jgi:hypothetical protein
MGCGCETKKSSCAPKKTTKTVAKKKTKKSKK